MTDATTTIDAGPTWADLLAAEPRLADLLAAARGIRRPTWHDYETYRRRLSCLVGWDAPASAHPLLRTCAAYTTCIGRLGDALRL